MKQRRISRRRNTRKFRGGAQDRLGDNVLQASLYGLPRPGRRFVPVNAYYRAIGDSLSRGYALLIGPRIGTTNEAILRATYPFEECIILLEFEIPAEYPNVPPNVLHRTPTILGTPDYRIHPNLYEAYAGGPLFDGKVCLGLLGTYGDNEWTSDKTISKVLSFDEGILGILEADPGKYEPTSSRALMSSNHPQGILYNKHTFAECLEYTTRIYQAILQGEELPSILQPFREVLTRRAYSALDFLTKKVEDFITLNGESEMRLDRDFYRHKQERTVNFWRLHQQLLDALDSVPEELRVNVFPEDELRRIAERRATVRGPLILQELPVRNSRRRNGNGNGIYNLIMPPNNG